jgi:hypothetical protein
MRHKMNKEQFDKLVDDILISYREFSGRNWFFNDWSI